MDMAVSSEKRELRKRLLRELFSQSEEEIKRRSENVQNSLSNLSIYKEAKVIMGYYPLRGEVDILGMVRKSWGTKRFCFSVLDLEKENLRPFEVENLEEEFVLGPLGAMQPDTRKTKEVDVREIDMVIIPSLALDRQKNRLGRGAGFYDHFLKTIEASTKKVGVIFEFQFLESLPIHPSQDVKVDVVVSESFFIE
ncbi:MAG: 5-formyltetrahydrofolate cyclo-ligase [Candidatus Omnitrophica bacterium]|nr:5-formyltetrahydrofolate cyclo-ligase [Candidatus Omnitrophota bacterium]